MGMRLTVSLLAGNGPPRQRSDRGSEEEGPHIGTETSVQTPTGGSSEEYWSMGDEA